MSKYIDRNEAPSNDGSQNLVRTTGGVICPNYTYDAIAKTLGTTQTGITLADGEWYAATAKNNWCYVGDSAGVGNDNRHVVIPPAQTRVFQATGTTMYAWADAASTTLYYQRLTG